VVAPKNNQKEMFLILFSLRTKKIEFFSWLMFDIYNLMSGRMKCETRETWLRKAGFRWHLRALLQNYLRRIHRCFR